MCGISAVVAFSSASQDTAGRNVKRMHDLVPHRGPDGEGFWAVDGEFRPKPVVSSGELSGLRGTRVALGFRWLVVQDASPLAAQPMTTADGHIAIVFNGEIYNFVELRRELEALGHVFRTNSDTEVIVAAYEEWDVDAFRRFNGMWALLIVDTVRRRVVGSRDRFGIRPLFWARDKGGWYFASEAKQIAAVIGALPNPRYIRDYLEQGSIHHFDQQTFFRDIETVPPASYFVFDLDRDEECLKPHRYWEIEQHTGISAGITLSEASIELERLLRSAVCLVLRTEAVTGSFLSGGLDSSVLTAIMAEVDARKLGTYSIVFPGTEYRAFDESRYIDDFVAEHNSVNARTTIDASWIRESLTAVTRAHEEPLIASAQMAQYRAFELARQCGVRVVIDGQGADELLAGYPFHEWIMWRSRFASGNLLDALREARLLAHKFHLGSLALVKHLAGPTARRLGLRRRRYPFVRSEWFDNVAGIEAADTVEAHGSRERGNDHSAIGETIFRDLKSYRLRPILLNGDRTGMAHSIESRLPYLDHRVVEFALSLPAAVKVGFGERKRVLREVAKSRIPQSMLDRTDKMGFVTPEPLWLRRELRDDVRAAVSRLDDVPYIDRARARAFVEAFEAGEHDDFRAVWRLYALPAWLEEFGLMGGASNG